MKEFHKLITAKNYCKLIFYNMFPSDLTNELSQEQKKAVLENIYAKECKILPPLINMMLFGANGYVCVSASAFQWPKYSNSGKPKNNNFEMCMNEKVQILHVDRNNCENIL